MGKDLICIGELLIDFICQDVGKSLKDGEIFLKKAGGAPANVAATAARMGKSASFAGCVGADPFGDFLILSLENFGVDTSMITRRGRTTKAFVSIMDNGERDFIFDRGSDELYDLSGFEDRYTRCKVLHLGSATALLGGDIENSYIKAIELVEAGGGIISFDPNYREDLWKDRRDIFIEKSMEYIKRADFVKLSDEELLMITGKEDIDKGLDAIFDRCEGVVAVTLGSKGTMLATSSKMLVVPSIEIAPVDTTGAGDAFVGAFLSALMNEKDSMKALEDFDVLTRITAQSNEIAAMVCTNMGAMSSLMAIERKY